MSGRRRYNKNLHGKLTEVVSFQDYENFKLLYGAAF